MCSDEYLEAIHRRMSACSDDINRIQSRWKTFKNAWRRCDKPQYYGWLLQKLSYKNDYYRRAVLSVLSQFLYEYFLDQDDDIEDFTRALDEIAGGNDEAAAHARRFGRKLERATRRKWERTQFMDDDAMICMSAVEVATSFISKRGIDHDDFESFLELFGRRSDKKRKRVCQLIRIMVERPSLEDINAYSYLW